MLSMLFIIFFCLNISSLNALDRLTPQVLAKIPHELPAFTQGLAIVDDQLYESTGNYGQSSLRKLDILTGKVQKKKKLPPSIFAEGIAAFPHHIIQLTWRENQAYLYERATFKLEKTFFYSGEGWGLCCDGETVWMSNGSPRLVQRDIKAFDQLKTIDVHQGSRLIQGINDLECVGNDLYANIFKSDLIIRIDKRTGEVNGIIDASHLLSAEEKEELNASNVLNGIAYRPSTETFFVTGKEWPWIFEIKLVERK